MAQFALAQKGIGVPGVRPVPKYLGHGRHRDAFLGRSGKWVIKVPRNRYGERANDQEAADYAAGNVHRGRLARCRMVRIKGFLFLMMERVTIVAKDTLPAWSQAFDARQVGVNRRGRFVAYDWAG